MSAHHRSDSDRGVCAVDDHSVLRPRQSECPLDSIEGGERLAILRPTHPYPTTGELVQIECMARVPELKHHEV